LGRDQNTRRLCAIRLGDVGTHEQAELAVRYHGELEAATQIRCENVIDVFDQGDWNGIPYLVMERLEGEILAERLLRQRPLDPWTTYRIAAHVACALSRAHGVGVVHRDLDPEHIILVPAGKHEIAKVFDFGVTRQENEWAVDRSTKLGSQQGLPYYASPERAGGFRLDWRSDLWSLAIIAYECLTGRRPFESDALGDLLARILHQPIPEISCPTLDPCPALTHWWERAVTRERTERFQTAKDLADELGAALRLPVIRVPALRPMFREDYAPSPSVAPTGGSVASADGSEAPARVPVRQTTRIGLGDSVAPAMASSDELEAARDEELGADGDYAVVERPLVDWRWVGVAVAAFVVLAGVYLGLGWLRKSRVVAGSPTGEVMSASASAIAPPVAAPGSSALTGTPETTAAPEAHAALPGAAETARVPPAEPDEARSRTPAEPAAASRTEVKRSASLGAPAPAPTGAAPTRRASPAPPTAPTPPRASPATPTVTTSPTATTPREQAAPPSTATFPPAPAPAPGRTRDYGI
jgi:serine/threonine-protein kinase